MYIGVNLLDIQKRVSKGQAVMDIAFHYYAGLKRISLEDAFNEFNRLLSTGVYDNPWFNCAIRMAEREVESNPID